jgi:AcrR family transcriptional regulator
MQPPTRERSKMTRDTRGRVATADSAARDVTVRHGMHVLEMQRRRLLYAIYELAGEQSLDAAGVGSICKRAGVSRRTFYELFGDREACLLAALDDALDRLAPPVAAAYVSDRRWPERVRAALDCLLGRLDAEPGMARLCVVETLRAGPDAMQWRGQTTERIAAALDYGRPRSRQGGEDLPPLTGQGVVGGALSVIHARLLESDGLPLAELLNPLMAMIVQSYLGAAAAKRELERSWPVKPVGAFGLMSDPFKGLPIRFTYRTARVIATIAAHPGASNRTIAASAEVGDEGQMSRLLRRLEGCGLIENRSDGHAKGEANAWALTPRGQAVNAALGDRPT